MKHLLVVPVLALCMSLTAAQDACPVFVREALDTLFDGCEGLGRNQACYGNTLVEATGRTPEFSFDGEGDIASVTDFDTLAFAPYDSAREQWGVVKMSLQANIPNSLPGQNVTVILLGDVDVQQVSEPLPTTSVFTTGPLRLRSTPDTTSDNIITVMPGNTLLMATGRNEAGDWLRLVHNDPVQGALVGWASTVSLGITEPTDSLMVITPGNTLVNAFPAPMQAFTFSGGIGDSPCSGAPDSGLIISTPAGSGKIAFEINTVRVSVGSTLWLRSVDDGLRFDLATGSAVITADDTSVTVPAGAYAFVPTDDDGFPTGAPQGPMAYGVNDVGRLPLTVAAPYDPATDDADDVEIPSGDDAATPGAEDDLGADDGAGTDQGGEAVGGDDDEGEDD